MRTGRCTGRGRRAERAQPPLTPRIPRPTRLQERDRGTGYPFRHRGGGLSRWRQERVSSAPISLPHHPEPNPLPSLRRRSSLGSAERTVTIVAGAKRVRVCRTSGASSTMSQKDAEGRRVTLGSRAVKDVSGKMVCRSCLPAAIPIAHP